MKPATSGNHGTATRLERSSGRIVLSFKSSPAGTALDELYQQGCCKVRFPRQTDSAVEAVLLNTAGGLTDGDTLNNDIRWHARTRATVTTQAAERVYRAAGDGVASISTRIGIDEDCVACWLPQETIVFDGGRVARTLEIDMHSSSRLVALESTVFGRRAMGEIVNRGRVSDRWRIRIDGRLEFADSFLADDGLTGNIEEHLARTAVANTSHCIATMAVVVEDGGTIVNIARGIDARVDATVGASCLGPLVILRILASDSQAMRAAIAGIVASLGETLDIELPRVWQC